MLSELAASQQMFRVMAGQSKGDSITRNVMLKVMPKWLSNRTEYKASYRPQASFLERIENKGTLPVQEQKPSKKYLALQFQLRTQRIQENRMRVTSLARQSTGENEDYGHENSNMNMLEATRTRTRSTTSSSTTTAGESRGGVAPWSNQDLFQRSLEHIITKD
jgi:hypothetical protein